MGKNIRLGISACLLGNEVRFDGGHKRDAFLIEFFGLYAEFVPVCPEVECGFPVPREPFHLMGDPKSPRLMSAHSGKDFTEHMAGWARMRVAALGKEGLWGFIFKSQSPSCGMAGVKVYNEGLIRQNGAGIFASSFMHHFPLLVMEEERGLHDLRIRENFMERLFIMKR